MLEEIIKKEIKKNGPIPFSKYMEYCLYHPEKGYYRGLMPPIGKSGDYYTSPCVHKMFGYIMARQIAEILSCIDAKHFFVVEAGAGNGYLARDIGEYLKNKHSNLHKKLTMCIIEPHLPYRDLQLKEISPFYEKIEFISSLDDLTKFSGVFYSNELFDSMPVEILESDDDRNIKQIYVGLENDNFIEINMQMDELVKQYLDEFDIKIPPHFRIEISPLVTEFYKKIAEKLDSGAIITIDYGYPRSELLSEQHNRGTLMCYYRHVALENPYIRIGKQDITAHIDFTALKEVGEKAGLITAGFVEQYYFLMSAGILKELEELSRNIDRETYEREIIKIKNILMPSGMGEIFKVLVQTRHLCMNLIGFNFKNRKKSLDLHNIISY